MEFYELCNKINLPKEIMKKIGSAIVDMDFKKLNLTLELLMNIKTAPEAYDQLFAIFADDAENIKLLICNLECARRLYDKYEEVGISEQIFIDTMKCFSRFTEECKVRNGSYYFDRGWWTYRQISMQIFRIGELEYELSQHVGEKAVSLHIPSDADLSSDNVDASLALARQFLAKYYPAYADCRIVCDSWLLAPALKALLNESSNILSFQDRFEIISTNPEAMDCLEWVFRAPAGTMYCDLKEDTSLQRKIKQVLLDGGHIGTGVGVMK